MVKIIDEEKCLAEVVIHIIVDHTLTWILGHLLFTNLANISVYCWLSRFAFLYPEVTWSVFRSSLQRGLVETHWTVALTSPVMSLDETFDQIENFFGDQWNDQSHSGCFDLSSHGLCAKLSVIEIFLRTSIFLM